MIKFLAKFAAAIALVAVSGQALAQPVSLDDLRARIVERLEQSAPDAQLTSTPEGLVVSFEDGREFRLYLDRALSRVEAGEPIEAVVDGIVASTLATEPGRFDPARAFILVRPAEFVRFSETQAPEEIELVSRPFAGDLVLVLTEDLVDRFIYPTSDTVSEVDPDLDGVWRAALARTHAEQGESVLEAVQPGIWVLTARWDIAASLLLDDAVWTRSEIAALGEVAVGVFRDALLLVETGNHEAIAQIRGFLVSNRADPNYQSDLLFVRRNGVWRVLD